MILEKLNIRLMEYGDQKGQHVGEVTFAGKAGKVSLNLTPELCNRIFSVCADGLIATAKEAAVNMTCQVLEHKALCGLEGAK